MKINATLFLLVMHILIIACKSQTKEISKSSASTVNQKDSLAKDSLTQNADHDLLALKTFTYEGYAFKFRYLKYNTDDVNNPGVLQVYKNEKLIFIDSIKGEGVLYIDTLGYHNVAGRKLFFTLNYGIEACDYAQSARYYFISRESNVHYLNEYFSQCGGDGYSCMGYKHVFPEDSSGVSDVLRIVEGLHYNEHDHPDLFDTTNIYFTESKFNISKLTHNLQRSE